MEYPILGIKYYLHSIFDLVRLKLLISVIGGILFNMIGIEEAMMKSAMLIYFIDFAFGIGIAVWEDIKTIDEKGFIYWLKNEKYFSVTKFSRGLLKAGIYAALLIMFNQVDIIFSGMFNWGLDTNLLQTRYYYLGYIAVTEALSILKKAAKIGIPVPQDLVDRLSKYKKDIPKETSPKVFDQLISEIPVEEPVEDDKV